MMVCFLSLARVVSWLKSNLGFQDVSCVADCTLFCLNCSSKVLSVELPSSSCQVTVCGGGREWRAFQNTFHEEK
eukprot:12813440-Heterocapsa_arctica.AAC.1